MRPNVLLIDDHDHSLVYQKMMWRKFFNITPVFAKTHAEALDKLEKKHYDLIITDYQMHGMLGDELAIKIRLLDGYMSVPIIVLSSLNDKEVVKKCMKSGVNDFILKSADENVYFNKIAKLVDLTDIPTIFEFAV
jgi:CheY-like chemotaxis protein